MVKYKHPPVWWNGRHQGLKIPCRQLRTGSSPVTGTKKVTFVWDKGDFLRDADFLCDEECIPFLIAGSCIMDHLIANRCDI